MLSYKYTARNTTSGEKVSAEVQAENEQAVARLLKEQGLAPLEIEVATTSSPGLRRIFKHIKSKNKVLFSRQLATLINAGLPLSQSLHNVSAQTSDKQLKVIINQIITDVESGQALSVAMGKHPEAFNKVYVSLIAAGETSGTLDKALERLAMQQEKDAELVSKVRGAMVYPIIVIFVMMLVVGFMIVKVLPQVEVLYKSLPGAKLPFLTVALLAVSRFIIHFWSFLIIGAIAIGILGSRWTRTLGGKRVVDKLKMKIWPVGPLFMKMYMARFARTATTLVASGVPLIQMLQVTSEAVDNYYIEKSLKVATDKVKNGKSLSDTLKGDPNFLDLVPDMLKIGEQSGSMEQMLEKTADYYEKEVDNQIKTVSTIIEPVLMILLGIFAFIIVAAVLIPIYGLAGQGVISK